MTVESEIIRTFRQSFLVYFFQFLASLIILLGAFFFMIPLFRFGWWGMAIFWFLIGLSILYGLVNLIKWLNGKLVITQNQLILFLQKGVFTQQIVKIGYEKISNINIFFKGFFSTIFRLGTIEISLSDGNNSFSFSGLRGAGKIQEIILKLQANQKLGDDKFNRDLTQYQMMELARSLRKKLGRDVFRQIAEEEEN